MMALRSPVRTFLGLCSLSLFGACGGQREIEPSEVAVIRQSVVSNPPSVGAVTSGSYRNLFVEWLGVSQAQVDAKVDALWNHYFGSGSTSTLYNPDGSNANGDLAYIFDTGNRDIRSEGMSYGMMIAVQLDKQAEFNALWNYAKSKMQHQTGDFAGYFAWQLNRRGNVIGEAPASDGEEYFATALFFASHRWGDGNGIYDYSQEANAILNTMLHKEDMAGGVVGGVTNMFDATYQQVVFTPYYSSAEHTNPSYHLPAFYELWGRWAEGYSFSGGTPTLAERDADRQFWLDAAAASRTFFDWTTHPNTGLSPDYAFFTGEPHPDYQDDPEHMDFRYDAWRTAMNWAVDYSWWAADENQKLLSDRLLTFFYNQGVGSYGNLYTLDGTELSGNHSLGLVATNGAAALAATSNPAVHAQEFVQELWDTEPQFGNYRYYDGLLQFMAFLHVAGEFRAHLPGNGCSPSELSCSDSADDDCDGLVDCADSDCAADAACDSCGNAVCGAAESACTCAADCGPASTAESSCADGADDDCDGLIDCADADCAQTAACEVCGNGSCSNGEDVCSCSTDCGVPPVESCGNGEDDDCDGDVDCADADCAVVPECQGQPGSLELAPIFGAGMVLQRDMPVPVFGRATPGAAVSVEFQGQLVVTSADANGDFHTTLPAMLASATPQVLTVSSGVDSISLTGVQVGEVWVCSGQSNMGWKLTSSDGSAPYIADAGNHNLHLFRMHNDDLPTDASWQASSPSTAADFSAVCYWMGLDLAQTLGVPVGLIQASYDGSAIEEWEHSNGGTGQHYDAMIAPLQPVAIKGVLWYQGESNGGDASYEAKLSDMLFEWRSGWGRADLPFGIVQLPATKWNAARSAQYNVSQADPNAYLVVTHDLPGGTKLHPTAKYEVGIRSSIGARATVYDALSVAGGPLPAAGQVVGDTFIIDYTQAGLGLATNDGLAPGPFELKESGGRYVSATASIVGSTIQVSSNRVSAPVSVRFAFAGSGNVVNTVSIPVEGGNTVTQIPGSMFQLDQP